MSRYLLVDVGAGTMDVLYFDTNLGQPYKAVVRSPVRTVAEKAEALAGDLVVTGGEMGGGPITDVLRRRSRQYKVTMSVSAAATLHHDVERVRSWGIRIVDDETAEAAARNSKTAHLHLEDLDPARIRSIVESFGVPFDFDIVAACAQDHGVPPTGVSHLEYRHLLQCRILDQTPYPHAMLYDGRKVPPAFNRLASLARSAAALPTREIYVMDSGMAAILGASMDASLQPGAKAMVLDVATSHTVGAALEGEEIAGFFEYHTRDITLERLEALLEDLAEGKLEHKRILAEGGHGAYMRKTIHLDAVSSIVATGPKRALLKPSRLPIRAGAPWGDNMMTGTVGLLEAVRRYKNLPQLDYD